jgi:starch synthase (maltosyl-transferring)
MSNFGGKMIKNPKKRKIKPNQSVRFENHVGRGPEAQRGWVKKEYRNSLLDSVVSQPIVIQNVIPEIDAGRYAIKREVGDTLEVWADIFTDGHTHLKAALIYREYDSDVWEEENMELVNPGLARWKGEVELGKNTRYIYTIESWIDEFGTWHSGTTKKREAGQDISVELIEGRDMLLDAIKRLGLNKEKSRDEEQRKEDYDLFANTVKAFEKTENKQEKASLILSGAVLEAMERWPAKDAIIRYDKELEVFVDRKEARFAAWYEISPRSQGERSDKHGTFKDCEKRLPDIAAMGFDVVYMLPVHPIGEVNRKGKNNTLDVKEGDPGSPYAIGSKKGGHKSVHEELGTLEDFRHFVGECKKHNMEVAIDFAIQCAPDHPWVTEHPEWFRFRPDGTIKYAENPPKKYQDIVNVEFYGKHQKQLWNELLDVVLFWVKQGVKIFRVDNPHTKPIPFWEWLIREVKDKHPDVLFLAEAFTRPPMMKMLAKVGFCQSYTYFTWRNDKQSLTDYLVELTHKGDRETISAAYSLEDAEYMRPNFFPSTPDILPWYLQQGGRAPFIVRFLLASTLSGSYGIYNGFELCESEALQGKEEYKDSDKYEVKVRDWNKEGNIKEFIGKVNGIRRENPALQELDNLKFSYASDENVIFYSKMTKDKENMIFIVVNMDAKEAHGSQIVFPLNEMNIPDGGRYKVEELLSGDCWEWQGAVQNVHLYPAGLQAQIFRVTPIDRLDSPWR